MRYLEKYLKVWGHFSTTSQEKEEGFLEQQSQKGNVDPCLLLKIWEHFYLNINTRKWLQSNPTQYYYKKRKK